MKIEAFAPTFFPGLLAAALAASLGCAKVTPVTGTGAAGTTGTTGAGGQGGRGGSTGAAGTTVPSGTGGTIIIATDGGSSDAPCTPSVTCTPAGGQYCGTIGNGCRGGRLECGACSGDSTCDMGGGTSGGLCVGGASCQAITCASGGAARYCGMIGDRCGRKLDCGACAAGQVCTSGVCTTPGCIPLTCAAGTTRYCGTIGDGCGGTLACGDCPAGSTCGGGGVPGVCAPTNCTPITCNPMGGGQYCGRIGNGCGGMLDCPACPGGMACGTGAQAGVCPGVPGTGGPCTGLACQINKCDGMPKTTVKGTVYDPAGRLPLYNVMVYVPNAALDPLAEGVSCQKCDTTISGRPVASALTDASGNFTMVDVPVGPNIPIVVQTGKWRRQTTLPMVKACQDNAFTGADTFRLPRTQAEGHIPKIAMLTGRADKLDCMMRVIGVADSEFTNPTGTGRVNLYTQEFNATGTYQAGGTFPLAPSLLGSIEMLSKYDMVIGSCSGESNSLGLGYQQPTAEKEAVKAYVDRGGRFFGSHFHFSYLRGPPGSKNHQPTPFPDVGPWDPDTGVTAFTVERNFPKGQALAQWLVNVGASPTLGSISLNGVEGTVRTLTTPYTRSWISSTNTIAYFSMAMPIEKLATPAEQCGRFVHTGLHVSMGGNDPFPSGCGAASRDLTPQEKAFEFLIFELSACAIPDNQQPTPPPVPPPGVPSSPPPSVTQPPAPPPPPPPPPPPTVD